MSEVSSWSVTDASNNLTPPDGWPEGMQPSGVNNVGRMMMGAIARWYSTVTTAVANCLPLSGGTLTGPLISSSDISARSFFASQNISAASGTVSAAQLTGGNLNVGGT